MRRHLLDRHDIGDRDLLALADAKWRRHVEQFAGRTPRLAAHLVVIAEHAVDLGHASEHLRLRLRRAAGDDDPCIRPFALDAAD